MLAIPVLVALYLRLRAIQEGIALTAFLFGLLGAVGGYELAALQTPPATYYPGLEGVANRVLRYGCGGIGLLLIGWLILQSRALPRRLGALAAFG